MHPTEKEGQCEFAIFFSGRKGKKFSTILLSLDTTLLLFPVRDTSKGLLLFFLGGERGSAGLLKNEVTYPTPSQGENHALILDGPQTRKHGRNKRDPSVMGMPLPLASYALLFKSLCTYLCNSRLKISLPKADKWTLCGWYYPGHSVPNALCLTTKPPVKLIKLPISQLTFFLLCSVAFILLACLHTLQEMMSDQTSNAALKRFLI